MSKKTGFTKGPWIAVGRRVEHPSDRIPDICSCMPEDFGQDGRSDEEACANARLIAAAPIMLDALKTARYVVEMDILGYKAAIDNGCDGEGMQDGLDLLQRDLDIINYAIRMATGE